MVNVGENRARNGVTDCPESRNENLDFYHPRGTPHITVWSGAMRLTNLSSEIINNINYLMTIKAMSLTLNVQKDSIKCLNSQPRLRRKMIFERHRPRSSRKCDNEVPAAVGKNLSTANTSAGQINGYGALCRHKPIVTLGSTGCMMIRKCLADGQAHVPLKDTEDDSMREMVNVGENRARNGVTDCPESRNKNLDFYHPRGTPHITVWSGAMRLTSASRKNGLKSQFCLEDAILILPFNDSSHHTRKISLQSIKPSILKHFNQVERTRERFCKSGSSFYPQNSA
ncbi:hypothetical protein E3N88_28032 [Mikania micrantha]|uniref:Uncharacterized protein n=1 Tax=Mikania micrantha TaxID=192012 RepID=A0A5N6MYZ4_9ASTR|nr:hypothetical protein E3N88_28032 [Mikania micrantha]